MGAVASAIISTSVAGSATRFVANVFDVVEGFPVGSPRSGISRSTAHVSGKVHEIGEDFDPLVIRKRPCLYLLLKRSDSGL